MEITKCPPITKSSDRHKINSRRVGIDVNIVNAKSFSCDICRQRNQCKTLCPPMAWVVSKVEIEPPRERPKSVDYRQSFLAQFPDGLSTSENIFLLYFIDRKDQSEIAKLLNISRQSVNKSINRVQRIVIQNIKKRVAKIPI